MSTHITSFVISGDLAHFRKPASNMSRLTYYVPPKMTVAGLLSAICGFEQDSYYDVFSPENYALSVEPLRPVRTITIPQNVMGTSSENLLKTYNNRGKGPKLQLIDPTEHRKQRVFEYVKRPKYRINFTLENTELQEEITDRLLNSNYKYTPSLGSAKCISRIHSGSVTVQDATKVNENTIISLKNPVTDFEAIQSPTEGQIITEKITSGFDITEGSRGTNQRQSIGFIRYLYRKDMQSNPLQINPAETTDTIFQCEDGSFLTLY